MIMLSTLALGFAVFFGQIGFMERRRLLAEIHEDFGTCDKIFPPYKHHNPYPYA